MSDRRSDDRDELSLESEQFAQRVAESFAPEPPSAAHAQAFDAALRERLEEPRGQSLWRPALATALLLSAIGWLLLPPADAPIEEQSTALEALALLAEEGPDLESDAAMENWLLTASEALELDEEAEDEFLPDDYAAIGGFLLDG